MCRTCSLRSGAPGFPFTRDNWTVEGVCNHAFAIWKRHWAPLAGVHTVGLVGLYGLTIATALLPADSTAAITVLTTILNVVQFVAQTWIPLAMFAVSLDVVRTGRVELDVALQSIARLPHALAQAALIMLPLAVVGGLVAAAAFGFGLDGSLDKLWIPLLAVSPLIGAGLFYYLTGVFFAQIALVDEPPLGPLVGIEASMRAVSGERARVALMMIIMGATIVAGLLLCCVGVIFSMGLANLMFATLYLALKAPPGSADYTPPS